MRFNILILLIKNNLKTLFRSKGYLVLALMLPLIFLIGIGYILAHSAEIHNRMPPEVLSAINLAFMITYSYLSLGAAAANRIALTSLREQPYLFKYTKISPVIYLTAQCLQFAFAAILQSLIIYIVGLPLLSIIGLSTVRIYNFGHYINAAMLGGVMGLLLSHLIVYALLFLRAPRGIGNVSMIIYIIIFVIMLMQIQNSIDPNVSIFVPWIPIFIFIYISMVNVENPLEYVYIRLPFLKIIIALVIVASLLIVTDIILGYLLTKNKITGKYKPEDIVIRV